MNMIVHLGEGQLSEDNVAAIRRHAFVVSDRMDPLYFIGRDDLKQSIEEKLALVRDARDSKSFGFYVQGAPGSGKSSLLRHLAQMDRQDIVPVMLAGHELAVPLRVVESFAGALHLQRSQLVETSKRSYTAGSDVWIFKESGGKDITIPSPIEQLKLGSSVWEIIAELQLRSDKVDAVFLVLIDEAQRIGQFSSCPIAVDLTEGNTRPVLTMPVVAGLSDTPNVLSKIGISRVPSGFKRLGELTQQEAEQVVLSVLDHEPFGIKNLIEANDRRFIAEALAVASDCWPRHLHCYCQSLLRSIWDSQNNDRSTKIINLNKVLDDGHLNRVRYYTEQLGIAALRKFEEVLFKVVQAHQDTSTMLHEDELTEMALSNFALSESQCVEYLEKAVHSGILERPESRGKHTYRCPIPSMQTYIQMGGDEEKVLHAMRQDVAIRLSDRLGNA